MDQGLPTNPNEESVKVVLKLALFEEEQLANRANWLDTKTGAILGFAIVSIAELLGFLLLASREERKLDIAHPWLLAGVFLLGLAAILVGMYLGLRELSPMGFAYGTSTQFLALQIDKDEKDVRLQCVDSLRKTTVANQAIVQKKAKLAKATALAVGVALLLYASAVAILFFSLFFGRIAQPSKASISVRQGSQGAPLFATSANGGKPLTSLGWIEFSAGRAEGIHPLMEHRTRAGSTKATAGPSSARERSRQGSRDAKNAPLSG
jgi:hypothetical protein